MSQLHIDRLLKRSVDSQEFYQMIQHWGVTLVGFGDVSCGLAKEFRHMPKAISLAIKHPPLAGGMIEKAGVAAYSNQFSDIDIKLEKIQKKIVTFLRLHGWRALAIPPDSDRRDMRFVSRLFPLFQHKTAATCAGLGWVGKNGLLVTREYGARLSWATVLTDTPLEVALEPYRKGQCNSCSRCVKACPAGAIYPEEWVREDVVKTKVNVEACAQQLKKNYQALGLYICGLCITACPLSRK